LGDHDRHPLLLPQGTCLRLHHLDAAMYAAARRVVGGAGVDYIYHLLLLLLVVVLLLQLLLLLLLLCRRLDHINHLRLLLGQLWAGWHGYQCAIRQAHQLLCDG
jgi:hypothetical protein